jgi:hypothetical protein
MEGYTKPTFHWKLDSFRIDIAPTMAYPNFNNGPKTTLCPVGVKALFSA